MFRRIFLKHNCWSLLCFLICFSYALKEIYFCHFLSLSSPFFNTKNYVITSCSDENSETFVRNVCLNYSIGRSYGSFCDPLCNGDFLFKSCLGHAVKENVLLGLLNGINIIMKSHQSQISSYPHLQSITNRLNVIKLTQQILMDRYFGFLDHNIFKLSTYIVSEFDKHPTGIIDEIELKQILYFVDQGEGFKTYFLNLLSVTPFYLGHCGVIYATTYMKDTGLLWALSNPLGSIIPWKFQSRIAIGFLDLVTRLDNVPFGPLYLCDVQMPNFGLQFIHSFPIVRVIDTDAAFFESYIYHWIKSSNYSDCSSDSDCSIFQCHVRCNMQTYTCFPKVLSNNLMNICNLFQKHMLMHSPIDVYIHLQELLYLCTKNRDNMLIFDDLYSLFWLNGEFD